jgi:hypothetical protein
LGNLTRRSMNFERKASQRFSRRASYAIRKKIQEQEILREQEDERLKKLKSEQEAKLDETKKSPEKNFEINKRSSSQKNLSLSPTQRLDNLIQASNNDLTSEDNESKKNATTLPRPPPIPPRQIKSEEKSTTPSVLIKQSNPAISASNDNNTITELSTDPDDQPLLIQMSPEKSSNGPIISSPIGKVNSSQNRYTLANSQSPYVLKETFFYTESATVNSNLINHQNSSNSSAPVIVTRTLSTSNVRNASSTIVQTTPTTCPTASSLQLPHLHPRTSSPSVGVISSSYHPITTEL